jgi:Ku70/Ku80 beta-barrel domain
LLGDRKAVLVDDIVLCDGCYRKVDAETGDEVVIKGYEVGKGQYIEIEPEELEAIAIESKRTIEIDEFVPKKEIDELAFSIQVGTGGSPALIQPAKLLASIGFGVISGGGGAIF